MKNLFHLLLLLTFINVSQSQAQDLCPEFMVKFWVNFSSYHGISTVPSFLIKNQCIAGPSQLVENYEKQERLLNQSQLEQDYFLSTAVLLNEDLLSYDTESEDDSDGGLNESNTALKVESNNVFQDWVTSFQNPEKTIKTQTDENKIKYNGGQQLTFINIVFITIKDNKTNTFLGLILFLILSIISYKYYKKLKAIIQPPPDKTCPDCGAVVKSSKHQCFICGSYV